VLHWTLRCSSPPATRWKHARVGIHGPSHSSELTKPVKTRRTNSGDVLVYRRRLDEKQTPRTRIWSFGTTVSNRRNRPLLPSTAAWYLVPAHSSSFLSVLSYRRLTDIQWLTTVFKIQCYYFINAKTNRIRTRPWLAPPQTTQSQLEELTALPQIP